MKDSKTSLLLTVSIILFVISLGLMSAGIYFYFKDRNAERAKEARKKEAVKKVPVQAIRDSSKKNYKDVMHQLDALENLVKKNTEDSNLNVKDKLQKDYPLRDEIPSLAGKTSITEIDSARKIALLQSKVDSLKIKSDKATLENQRLNASINQLKSQIKNASTINKTRGNGSANIPKPNTGALFTALDARLWAEDGTGGRTGLAQQAQNMVGAFTIRKREEPPRVNEVFIVIIQPDGSILKNLNWQSGIFETAEGRKAYSTKIVFEYNKEPSRQLNFKIGNESFQKGEYQFQIYQNGYSIGSGSIKLL